MLRHVSVHVTQKVTLSLSLSPRVTVAVRVPVTASLPSLTSVTGALICSGLRVQWTQAEREKQMATDQLECSYPMRLPDDSVTEYN